MAKEENNSTRFISDVLQAALSAHASDIHIDPTDIGISIKFRSDGVLRPFVFSEALHSGEIVGHIKVLAGLRIDVHDKAQDGRFFIIQDGKRVDIRVSIVPTYYGENVVLRILSQEQDTPITLTELGMNAMHQEQVERSIRRPQGLIIIAGPTGAGKTTTLYSLIHKIIQDDSLIITLEDPIEYSLPGVRQIPIKPERGFTFHSALKGILRQDPDVIMVGEIRDKETAQIAIQTALTGHLILSSIHAPDAISVIPRLMDMGIEPYLISATLTLVISQRLVRKKSPDDASQYRGRIGIFEVLPLSEHMKKMILKSPEEKEMRLTAKREGMKTMFEDGQEKAAQHITTLQEVYRVTYD